jgi:hypothetical protein
LFRERRAGDHTDPASAPLVRDIRHMPQGPPPDDGIVMADAVVIETTADGRVRLRLENGSEEELSPREEMFELLRPGLSVVLYQDPDGGLLGWYLPEHDVGHDLRP